MHRIFITFSLLILTLSCSSTEENPLVGTWKCDSHFFDNITVHHISIINKSGTSIDLHRYQLNLPDKDFIEYSFKSNSKIHNNVITSTLLEKSISNKSDNLELILPKNKQIKLLSGMDDIGTITTSKIISLKPTSVILFSTRHNKEYKCDKIIKANN